MALQQTALLALLVSLLPQFSFAQVQTPCHVCVTADREVTQASRGTSFVLTDLLGQDTTWTCGQLEDIAFESVLASNTVCGIMQAHARVNCECDPPLPPPPYLGENPACDICIDGRPVYQPHWEELVNTGIAGQMPCGFLWERSAEGFMPATHCPDIQANVAAFCCDIPPIDIDLSLPPSAAPGSTSTDAPTPAPVPTCAAIHDECERDSDCCSNYVCKIRRIGSPKTCSALPLGSRTSLASGRGGAAGRAKFSN